MTQDRIVEAYSRALAQTNRMFEAARSGDWDGLVLLERERDRMLDEIRKHEGEPPKAPELRQRKRELIREMLSRDEEIRNLTQDWMHELRDILSNVETVQRLSKTYSQGN
ncbi:MAG: hypothetical protein GC151_13335 [Betaproteobacteria bacterium]|nr:hypothetical protein [Betaproteobacteria bacterium]